MSDRKEKRKNDDDRDRKREVTVKSGNSSAKEVTAIIMFAVVVLLVLCFIGKAGPLGQGVSLVFFGVLGIPMSYTLLAIMVVLAWCMLRGTEKKVFRAKNVILLLLFLAFTSIFIFTCSYQQPEVLPDFWGNVKIAWETQTCGLAGGLSGIYLQSLIAKIATFVVVITGMLVTAILLFSLSVARFVKKLVEWITVLAGKIRRTAKRIRQDKESKKAGKQSLERSERSERERNGEEDKRDNDKPFTIIGPATNEKQGEQDKFRRFDGGKVTETALPPAEEQDEAAGTTEQLQLPMEEMKQKPYVFPPVEMLPLPESSAMVDNEKIREKAEKLEAAMRDFNVEAKVVNACVGPTVIRYELQPKAGVRVSQITNLANDIALNLESEGGVRIEAPIPGKAAIGIEVPNENKYSVYLREIIDSPEFKNSKSPLTIALGKDISGKIVVADIAKMPHLLVAGTTGAGKSIFLNVLLLSLLYKSKPEDVKLILLDPKVVELERYNGIPHLMFDVVTDSKKAAAALAWATAEMDRRYNEFAKIDERELEQYNENAEAHNMEKLPRIVIVIDELADLMLVAKDTVEDSINRLAAKARAAGIHLVIATQRPSVSVITGNIKANVTARISFRVSSFVDSKTILDCAGAEKLLGKGDMLLMLYGKDSIKRVQCAYADKEVREIIKFIKENSPAVYDAKITKEIDKQAFSIDKGGRGIDPTKLTQDSGGDDEYLEQAVLVALQYKKVSASFLQTKLGIGFQRSTRIVQWMEDHGVVSQRDGNNARDILIGSIEDYYKIRDAGEQNNE